VQEREDYNIYVFQLNYTMLRERYVQISYDASGERGEGVQSAVRYGEGGWPNRYITFYSD